MDNLCHTLVGAAIAEAGLRRRTRYGYAALTISANLPDVDVLVFATDTMPMSFRRGWTHGLAAQLLLPVLLTAVFVFVHRRRAAAAGDGRPAVHAGWLLALSYIGIGSHVILDLLNNYGIRLLAPFDWRWFYGDAVFIVDPVLWATLGAGVWLSRRRGRERPALASLAGAAAYVALMVVSAVAAREHVAAAWRTARGSEPRALMVGPRPLTPFSRQVIVDAGDRYEYGVFTWWPPGVTFVPEPVPKGDGRSEIADAVAASADIRGFLVWSRFPYWTFMPAEGGTRVTVRDMRFGESGAFVASTVVESAAR